MVQYSTVLYLSLDIFISWANQPFVTRITTTEASSGNITPAAECSTLSKITILSSLRVTNSATQAHVGQSTFSM